MSIHEEKNISQHKLARKIGVSSTMINNYMSEFSAQGLVHVSGNTNRSTRYALTQVGMDQTRQLMNAYVDEIACLYSAVKAEFQGYLNEFYKSGIRTVVFFGADETCEIVFNAAYHTPMEVVGLVDNDPKKYGRRFGNLQVQPPEIIETLLPDGVIITAMDHSLEIYNEIKHMKGKEIEIIRF